MFRKYIVVAGMNASGKTTLSTGIARHLNWEYIPESEIGLRYIPDIFLNTDRWAFEAQISFLADKALKVLELINKGCNFVLDRSLYEDVYIFAQYFYENRNIDQRSYDTYCRLYKYFFSKIPAPKLLIYCKCPLTVVRKRINLLDTETMKIQFVTDIFSRYANWKESYQESDMYVVDSNQVDFRKDKSIMDVLCDINQYIK